jgi:hypothetical protein
MSSVDPSSRHASERYVDVWVIGVEVRHRDPFELRAKVPLYVGQDISCEPVQINALTKLRGDDQLP